MLGQPRAIHLHGSEFARFAQKHRGLVRVVCCAANVVFVLTQESEDLVREITRSSVRVVRIVNAVDVPEVVASKSRTVLFCGEVGIRKGVDVLIEAWKLLGRDQADWELIIAGPLAPGFRVHQVPGLKLIGTQSHRKCLELSADAGIAVLPSRDEAMPMFLLESMARGCAVIGTPVGQVGALLDGAGEVVNVGDAEGLVRALRRFIHDDQYRARSALAARERVIQNHSSEAVRTELESEWLELATVEMR
jgi:glycosyltransferase involved in cell wall biosynthesis